MYQKQNMVLLDGLILLLVASLILGAWSFTRSLQLIRPSVQSTALPSPAAEAATPAALPQAPVLAKELTGQFRSELKAALSGFIADQPNDFAVAVIDLGSGLSVSNGADEEYLAASLYKPFAAVAALKMIDTGQLSLDTILSETGGRNVRQCVIDALSVSDNPCGLSLLSTTQLTVPKLKAEGYARTDLSGLYPTTTAGDVAKLFKRIHSGESLSRTSHQLLLGALKDQKINDRLPLGLPEGSAIAHKTGDLEGYVHDAGIVYGPGGDYIIVALSGPDAAGRTLAERYTAFGQLMGSVHKLVNAYQNELAAAESS
jgi:beta-lactamase class A